MAVVVSNFFKDEVHKRENINRVFAELVRHRLLEKTNRSEVLNSEALPRHDRAGDENEVKGHE